MTTLDSPQVPSDHRGPTRFYRHRSFVVGVAVLVVLAITVLTDLPAHESQPVQVSNSKTVISEINADVGPCSYAVGEAFTIYAEATAHSLGPSQLSQIPRLLNDDQSACSFVSDNIYQLSTIDVPGQASGRYLGQLVNSATLWSSSDALAAVEQIQTLIDHPGNAAALGRLAAAETAMTTDYGQTQSEMQALDNLLHTKLPAVNLARTPAASGTGLHG